jgi:hypothetical protein
MTDLSMKYQLVTDFVSLVAIDTTITNDTGNTSQITVPHYSEMEDTGGQRSARNCSSMGLRCARSRSGGAKYSAAGAACGAYYPSSTLTVPQNEIKYVSPDFDETDPIFSSIVCPNNHEFNIVTNRCYSCDVCKKYKPTELTFTCISCNYDVCFTCFLTKDFVHELVETNKVLYKENYHLDFGFSSRDEFEKFAEKFDLNDYDAIAALLYLEFLTNIIKYVNEKSTNKNIKHLIDKFFDCNYYIEYNCSKYIQTIEKQKMDEILFDFVEQKKNEILRSNNSSIL